MNEFWERTGTVLGRFLLALIFLASGAGKLMTFEKTATQVTGIMTGAGIPEAAVRPLLVAAIVFEIAGALMIITGFKTRWGAALLIVFLLVATPIFHAFWTYKPDQPQYQEQMNNFMKNVSIVGAMLLLVARGGGLCSFDNLCCKTVPATAGTERK